MPDIQKLKIAFEMMIAIEYLHNNNFIYRDLKPNNVILDHSGTLALIDLDRMISRGDLIANNEITKDFSLLFAAPEFNYGEVSFASDVYSIGMMMYYIITGNYPKSIINNFDDFPPQFSKLKKKCVKDVLKLIQRKDLQFQN